MACAPGLPVRGRCQRCISATRPPGSRTRRPRTRIGANLPYKLRILHYARGCRGDRSAPACRGRAEEGRGRGRGRRAGTGHVRHRGRERRLSHGDRRVPRPREGQPDPPGHSRPPARGDRDAHVVRPVPTAAHPARGASGRGGRRSDRADGRPANLKHRTDPAHAAADRTEERSAAGRGINHTHRPARTPTSREEPGRNHRRARPGRSSCTRGARPNRSAGRSSHTTCARTTRITAHPGRRPRPIHRSEHPSISAGRALAGHAPQDRTATSATRRAERVGTGGTSRIPKRARTPPAGRRSITATTPRRQRNSPASATRPARRVDAKRPDRTSRRPARRVLAREPACGCTATATSRRRPQTER